MKFKLLGVLLFLLTILIIIGQVSAVEHTVNTLNSTGEINNLINSMNPNDTLFFEDGIYQNKTILITKNNITLTANRGKVLFNGSGISNGENAFNISASYITIKNINISNYFNGISSSFNHNTIENCKLDSNEDGINITGNYNTIFNVTSSNNKNNGILLIGDNNHIEKSIIYNNSDGLWIMGNENIISNISSYNNSQLYSSYGIFIYGNNNSVSDFTLINDSTGISIEGDNNSIKNGDVHSHYSGISIEGNFNNVSHCNSNDHSYGDGILITGNYTYIINSTANNNYFGITIIGRYSNIIGCTANNNGQYGIHTASNASVAYTGENNVTNSVTLNNYFYGIFLEGGNDYINNCTVEGGMFGIYMSKDNNIIYNSKISFSSYGILIESGSNYNITGNILNNNVVTFIFADMGQSHNITIDFNLIFNNTKNFEIGTYSTSNIIANYNWWGGNPPINELPTKVLIQYFIESVVITNSSNAYYDTNLTLSYGFVMNGTNMIIKLPPFVAYLQYFNNTINLTENSQDYINVTLNSSTNTFYLFFNGMEFTIFNYTAIPYTAHISTTNVSTIFGNQANITGTFIDDNNIKLQNKNLTLIINGSIYYATTNIQGIATFYNISTPSDGLFQFIVLYSGNEYDASPGIGSLIVDPIITILSMNLTNTSYVNDQFLINISVKDNENNSLKNINLILVIDNKEYNITTNNLGIYIFNHTFNKDGTFKIIVYLKQNGYSGDNVTKDISIYKKSASIVSNKELSAIFKNQVNIVSTFIDENNTPLADKTLTLIINGSIYYATSNTQGIATFYNISTPSTGSFPFTIFYNGNDYAASPVSSELIINPIKTTISMNFPSVSYVNDQFLINISLTDIANNPLKNIALKLVIDNKEYNLTTNNLGIGIFYYTLNKEGTFKVLAYLNEKGYTGDSLTKNISIFKKSSLISVSNYNGVYNGTIYLRAKLTSNSSNSNIKQTIKGQNIDFYINQVYVGTGKTDSNGIAILAYKTKLTGNISVKAVHKVNNAYFGDVKVSYLNIPKLSIIKIKNIKVKDSKSKNLKSQKVKTIKLQTIVYNQGPDKSTFKISYKVPKNLKVINIKTSNKIHKISFNKKTRIITWKVKDIGIVETKKFYATIYLKVNKKGKYSFKPSIEKVNGLKVSSNNKLTFKV